MLAVHKAELDLAAGTSVQFDADGPYFSFSVQRAGRYSVQAPNNRIRYLDLAANTRVRVDLDQGDEGTQTIAFLSGGCTSFGTDQRHEALPSHVSSC